MLIRRFIKAYPNLFALYLLGLKARIDLTAFYTFMASFSTIGFLLLVSSNNELEDPSERFLEIRRNLKFFF